MYAYIYRRAPTSERAHTHTHTHTHTTTPPPPPPRSEVARKGRRQTYRRVQKSKLTIVT